MNRSSTSEEPGGASGGRGRPPVAAAVARAWPLALFAVAFAATALVFRPVWPLNLVLGGPDGMPDLSLPGFSRRVLLWAARGEATLCHDGALKMLLPSLVWHEWGLCATFALQALCMAVFLRTMRAPRMACCCGGVAFAFAGYNFTLFAAGHRGVFAMTPYAVLLFALVESAVRRPRARTAALAALAFIAGAGQQPDVILLYGMLLAAYAVFRLCSAPVLASEGASAWWRARRRGFVRAVAAFAATLAIVGAIPLRTLVGTALAGRSRQLSEATSASLGKESENPEAERRAKWIFATNWSLPPSETLEFAAPGLHGLDSGNPRGPYWGALGRSDGWSSGNPSGFFNYRQHSLYVGAGTCGLALFAVVAAMVGGAGSRQRRAAVVFFAAAGLVAWLLAMGRFAPLYRLLYALPVFDKIRAPVKFVHVVEFCAAVLAAFGAASISENRPETRRGRMFAAGAVMAAAAAFFAAWAFSGATVPEEALRAIGLSPDLPIARTLGSMRRAAFAHGGALLALVALCGAASVKLSGRRSGVALAGVLAIAILLDQTIDAASYVTPVDVSSRFAPCPPAAAEAKRHAPPNGRSWSYLELTRQPLAEAQLAPFHALETRGIRRADPCVSDAPDDPRIVSWRRLAFHPARFWALWGTSSVFVPRETARAFVAGGQGSVTGLYDIDRRTGRFVVPQDLRRAAVAVFEPAGVPPSAAVYRDWVETGPEPDAAFSAFAESSFDPLRTAAVSGPLPPDAPAPASAGGAQAPLALAAKWLSSPLSDPPANGVLVETDAQEAGLLVVRDYFLRDFMPRVKVTIDGEAAPPPLLANGAFPAVPVPGGRHVVGLSPDVPARATILPMLGAAIFVLLLGLWARDEMLEGRS